MKIAIPVEEKDIGTKVCRSFGRAPFFLVYDIEGKDSSFIENSGAESTGGAGIKAAQIIVDSKVDALLTPRCGENAGQVLEAGNIKIYKAGSINVKDNIDNFINGDLSILDDIHTGFHGNEGN